MEPSNVRIAGVALLLFSAVLLGVGIHHLVATGTCSSTGYSANYGPVPKCPSGTGWWFAFVFGGIIGCLVGALMAGGLGFVFAGIFGAIGFGALSIVLDTNAGNSTKVFGAVFGGSFAVVGVIAGIAVIGSALGSLRRGSRKPSPARSGPAPPVPQPGSAFGPPQPASAFGTPQADGAFGSSSQDADPIMSAYQATRQAAPSPSPVALVPGLQAAKRAAAADTVEELSKLAELHRRGALTDAEFATAKAKLLAGN